MSENKNTALNTNHQITPGNPGRITEDKRPLYDDNLIKRIEAFHDASGISWTEISFQSGLSQTRNSSVISGWRRKKYMGDVKRVNEILERFLRGEERKVYGSITDLKFVPIANSGQIMTILETAKIDRIIAAIIGDTGTGKTTAIREYIRDKDIIYIHGNRTYSGAKDYMRIMHQHRLVGKDGRGNLHQLTNDIIQSIKDKNVLIIIDQCDYLNLSSIDVLRTINEESNIGIVFIGLPSFLSTLRGNEPEVRQVRDRIRILLELKAYKLEDAKAILELNFPETNGTAETFFRLSNGSMRILSSLIYNVKKMMEKKNAELNEKTIIQASRLLDRRSIY